MCMDRRKLSFSGAGQDTTQHRLQMNITVVVVVVVVIVVAVVAVVVTFCSVACLLYRQ